MAMLCLTYGWNRQNKLFEDREGKSRWKEVFHTVLLVWNIHISSRSCQIYAKKDKKNSKNLVFLG